MKQSSNSGQSRKAGHQKRRLVILVAVLLVGLVALAFLYTNDGRKLFGLANPLVSQQQAETLNTSTTDQNTTDLSDRKFDIPELGITLTLPDGLEGLEYTIWDNEKFNTKNALFTTESLKNAKDATEYCAVSEAPIGEIVQFSSDPKTISNSNAASKVTVHLSSYYYVYYGPQQSCAQSDETSQLQIKQAELLQSSLKTAEIAR